MRQRERARMCMGGGSVRVGKLWHENAICCCPGCAPGGIGGSSDVRSDRVGCTVVEETAWGWVHRHGRWREVSFKGPSHHDRDRMGYFAAKSSSIEFVREGDLEKLYFHLEESKKMSQIYRKPCTRWAELVVSAR